MSLITEHYLIWLKSHKKGDNRKNFKTFILKVLKEQTVREVFVQVYYEMHKINKKFRGLND